MDTFLELLKLGIVGLIAGLFSAYIATREHRNKKWWELRVVAYQSVIEALLDLTHYYNRKYKAEMENRELSKEYEAELDKFWDESYHKIRKASDSGVFLFSNEVNQALKEFVDLKNIDHHTYFEYLDSNLSVAEKCLKTVVSSANKDLRVKDTWL
ncbi:hypothetical protein [Candidatus Endoriftia persephonae]|jgi:uncharacterized Ntn-hydrolase superfamily protein|uniref:Uncharacterized protein n=1 Tax=Candidatus Endoriftia persephonae TaxID=393765 RepID=A0A9J6ZU76_9GAMM|nr:hypothetical protein [Candidatus Endoriftia persephone]USF86395.1 hypothetical protein L0Y14_09580 [Candidatus Endoriftia persephone]